MTVRPPLLGRAQFLLILLFTTVETAILTIWLYILIPSIIVSMFGVLAVVVLFVGLLVEHTIATITGNIGPWGDI